MCIAVMKGLGFFDTQESYFDSRKRSHWCCAALLCGRIADAREWLIQAANRSEMCSAVLKYSDAQESLIKVAKRSNVGSSVMKGLRLSDSEEWCFEAWKR